MNRRLFAIAACVVLCVVLCAGRVRACTWAAFAAGKAAVIARTMDWYADDNLVVKGRGRNVAAKAADTPNALEYASRYACIEFHSFRDGLVVEAMNEKGLQGSILFLDDSELPAARPGRKDVDPGRFISYAVASFATVREIVDALEGINFIPVPLGIPDDNGDPIDYPAENWPGHYAFADATGDKLIIEFIKGETKIYHGREHDAITNEPWYDIHLQLDYFGYPPNGSISTIDRRGRAKLYLRDMHERGVDSPRRAILAMRGLLASVFAGTEEIDRTEDEVYPTLWSVVADQNRGVYYCSRTNSWCSEIYDFSMFPPEKPEVVVLKAADCPYPDI